MKAAVYYSLDDVRIEEMPTPEIGPEEILVEMKACGICGSDFMDWYLENRAPLVPVEPLPYPRRMPRRPPTG